MADNVPITSGSGISIASDDISGVQYQRVKLIIGADGTNDGDVYSANPMPVVISGSSTLTITGSTTVINTVSVTGSTAIVGTVTVAGTATITGSTTVINTVNVTGSTAVVGVVTITGSTAVVGVVPVTIPTASTANIGTVILSNGTLPINITGSTTIIGTVPVSGTVTITGATTVINEVAVSGSTVIIGTVPVSGTVTITGATTVINTVAVTGSTTIVGTVTTSLPTAIKNGAISCPTAGVAVTIATSTICKKLFIGASDTNTGKIHIGGSSVTTASGIFIYPGASMQFEISDLTAVYMNTTTNGDTALFTYTE